MIELLKGMRCAPTCLIVIAGFHDFSSSKIDRQTVPDGYTLGWKSGGVNLPTDGNRPDQNQQENTRFTVFNHISHLGGFVG